MVRKLRAIAIFLAMTLGTSGCLLNTIFKNIPSQNSRHLTYSEHRGIEIGPVDSDRAVVVFLRPEDVRVSSLVVLEEEELVTHLTERTYFVLETTPGSHSFWGYHAKGGSTFVDAELEGGRVYAIAFLVHTTGPLFVLEPITPSGDHWSKLGDALADSLRVHPTPAASMWFEANRSKVLREHSTRDESWRIRALARRDGVEVLPAVSGQEYDRYEIWNAD